MRPSTIHADSTCAWWNRDGLRFALGECQCGCGRATAYAPKSHTESGYVAGMPRKYMKGHHTRLSGQDWIEDENGCWMWQLAKSADGYGSKFADGGTVLAHRWYYAAARGPIPEGLTLDHLCRVRACVRPDHLEPVTLKENIHRGIAAHGGRWGLALRKGVPG